MYVAKKRNIGKENTILSKLKFMPIYFIEISEEKIRIKPITNIKNLNLL